MSKRLISIMVISILITFSYEKDFHFNFKNKPKEEISINEGERFTIQLHSNPSTGYEWVQANEHNIIPLSEEFIFDTDNQNYAGKGGTYYCELLISKKGRYVFHFQYKRSWEDEAITKGEVVVHVLSEDI